MASFVVSRSGPAILACAGDGLKKKWHILNERQCPSDILSNFLHNLVFTESSCCCSSGSARINFLKYAAGFANGNEKIRRMFMGLWLKCPGCQTKHPLALRVCPKCGRSLDNLPRESRVYVIGPPDAAVPETPPAPRVEPAAAVASEAPKPAKKPKKPRKKKS